MLTKEQFQKRWEKITPQQKKFCLRYIECFDAREAAIESGYTGVTIKHPIYRVLRKVSDITDYLIAKQNLYSQLVKKQWILTQFQKLYDSTTSVRSKTEILDKLSKILQLQSEPTKVEVNNHIPSTPVTINFSKDE